MYASLDDYLFSKKKKVEEDAYMLKEKLVETSNIYFEHMKEQVAFIHHELDLGLMYIFKVVLDGQLVDDGRVLPLTI